MARKGEPMTTCPFCGEREKYKEAYRVTWGCLTWQYIITGDTSGPHQSLPCRIRELEAENERLREIVVNVAASGIEYDARKYLAIQIDPETWDECRKEAER